MESAHASVDMSSKNKKICVLKFVETAEILIVHVMMVTQ
jgi:hypothetical protein